MVYEFNEKPTEAGPRVMITLAQAKAVSELLSYTDDIGDQVRRSGGNLE